MGGIDLFHAVYKPLLFDALHLPCPADREDEEALAVVRGWTSRLVNLQLVGRNGQHRYNNQDHSMMTGAHAAWNLGGGEFDVWGVNVEQEYHEEGQSSSVSGDRAVPSRVAPVGAKGDG